MGRTSASQSSTFGTTTSAAGPALPLDSFLLSSLPELRSGRCERLGAPGPAGRYGNPALADHIGERSSRVSLSLSETEDFRRLRPWGVSSLRADPLRGDQGRMDRRWIIQGGGRAPGDCTRRRPRTAGLDPRAPCAASQPTDRRAMRLEGRRTPSRSTPRPREPTGPRDVTHGKARRVSPEEDLSTPSGSRRSRASPARLPTRYCRRQATPRA
jgi:hypothetical protein